MSSRRKRQPVLNFSNQIDEIVADNTLETRTVERRSDKFENRPESAPKDEADQQPPTQETTPPTPKQKPSETNTKRQRTLERSALKDKDASAKIPISVRVPICSARLLDTVRQDARTYHASENRLLGVHVRRAVERLREAIRAGDLTQLDISKSTARTLATYSTSLMMAQTELNAIADRIDPRGYFGFSRNLAMAVSLLIEDSHRR